MNTKRDRIAAALVEVEGILPSASLEERNDWRTIWMMLVGAWYLLGKAEPFLQGNKISYRRAQTFARKILGNSVGPEDRWPALGRHPWPAGFYLVSTEHRLANAVDRLTRIFAGANLNRIPGGRDLYERCKSLATHCPHCQHRSYLSHVRTGRTILARFGAEGGQAPKWPRLGLARVYMRVNEIKHGPKNQPLVVQQSTKGRSGEAVSALSDLTILIGEFATHRASCTMYKPLKPLTSTSSNKHLQPSAAGATMSRRG